MDLQVRVSDWRNALRKAPKACSQRQGISALALTQTLPLPYHLAPLLLAPLQQTLQQLANSGLQLPSSAAAACKALHCPLSQESRQEGNFEQALVKLGVIQPAPEFTGTILSS